MGLMDGKVFWMACGPMSDGEVGTMRTNGGVPGGTRGLTQCRQNAKNGG